METLVKLGALVTLNSVGLDGRISATTPDGSSGPRSTNCIGISGRTSLGRQVAEGHAKLCAQQREHLAGLLLDGCRDLLAHAWSRAWCVDLEHGREDQPAAAECRHLTRRQHELVGPRAVRRQRQARREYPTRVVWLVRPARRQRAYTWHIRDVAVPILDVADACDDLRDGVHRVQASRRVARSVRAS